MQLYTPLDDMYNILLRYNTVACSDVLGGEGLDRALRLGGIQAWITPLSPIVCSIADNRQ